MRNRLSVSSLVSILAAGTLSLLALAGCKGSPGKIVTPPDAPTAVVNTLSPLSGYAPLPDTINYKCTAQDGIVNYSFTAINASDTTSNVRVSQNSSFDNKVITLQTPGIYQTRSSCTSVSGQTTSRQGSVNVTDPMDPSNWDYEITFTSDGNTGNDDLYFGGIKGDSMPFIKRITTEPMQDFEAVWSPDGKKLAYVSNEEDVTGDGVTDDEVFTIGIDGSDKARITSVQQATYPDWCSNNKIIFGYINGGLTGVDEVNPDGSGLETIVSHSFQGNYVGPQACSPDGSQIAYGDTEGIYTVSSQGGTPSLLVAGGNSPAWSPDGKEVAYVLNGDVYAVNVKTKISRRITTGGGIDPTFSSDGKKVAFVRDWQLWMANRDGSSPVQLTDSLVGSYSRFPDFRPSK